MEWNVRVRVSSTDEAIADESVPLEVEGWWCSRRCFSRKEGSLDAAVEGVSPSVSTWMGLGRTRTTAGVDGADTTVEEEGLTAG